MAEQRKSGKRKYLGDYEKSNTGEYIYTGQYFTFDMPQKQHIRMRISYPVMALATALLFVFAGFINNEGSRVIYVVLPYAAMFLPIAFMLSDVYKIVTIRENMTLKQYDRSIVQLKHVSIAVIILSSISLAGDIVFLVTGFSTRYQTRELLFLAASAVILLLNIIFVSIQNKLACFIKRPEAVDNQRVNDFH